MLDNFDFYETFLDSHLFYVIYWNNIKCLLTIKVLIISDEIENSQWDEK